MLFHINSALQALNFSYLFLLIWLLIRKPQKHNYTIPLLFFALGVLFIILGHEQLHYKTWLSYILVILMYSPGLSFLFLTKSIFQNEFKISYFDILISLIFISLCLTGHYIRLNDDFDTENPILLFLISLIKISPQLSTLGLGLYSLWIAVQDWDTDLIEKRLEFRKLFIVITGICVFMITAGVIWVDYLYLSEVAILILNSLIFIPLALFIHSSFRLDIDFEPIIVEDKKLKPLVRQDILDRLTKMMEQDRLYLKEDISIKFLSEILLEPEYKIRQIINSQWNFKNFNDYINQYRVEDAKKILQDSTQNKMTVLEISYQLGYKSISPFNKAFKERTGFTPTVYRKTQQQSAV